MSRLSPDFIQELNDMDITRLLDVRGIKLRGGNHVEKQIPCVSPAHDDKNPSMSVNIDTGQFHCHGCGTSGAGCISMFAAMTGQDAQRDFRDVVEGLAQTLGIEPVYSNSNDKAYLKTQSIKEAFFGLVQQSMKTPYFPDDRQSVSAFLSERKVTNADREMAKIGFIPRNFQSSPFAKENEELLKEIGVLKVSERSGNTYSPFGGRVVFPITNEKGEIIAIAGRRLGDEGGPKYINSDENPAFHKSQVLYGLYSATKGLEPGQKLDRLIVVEGYMDAITSQTRGFPATVATMGTAATPQHFKLIARKAKGVTFVFDPDDAGKRAGERALMNALPYAGQLDIRFAEMPVDGDVKLDPDQMLKTLGPEAYGKVIDSALSMPAYAAQYIIGNAEAGNLMELLQGGLEERGQQVFSSIPPGITRQLLSVEIARQIGDRLGLALSPEHIGMTIDYEQQVNDLQSENEDLRAENDKLLRQIERLQATSPQAGAANYQQDKTIDQVSAAKPKADDKPYTPPISRPAVNLNGDTSKVESSNANVAPFSMEAIRKDAPQSGRWVMASSGRFGLVEAIEGNNARMTMTNGELMTLPVSECITLEPRKVIVSKHDGHFHRAGDQILHMGTGWYGGWPASHHEAAKALLANGNSRSVLEGAASLALSAYEVAPGSLQDSLVAIRNMSVEELKQKIGMSEADPQRMNVARPSGDGDSAGEKMPSGFLINAQPRAKDFVTSKQLAGKVLVVDEDIDGSLCLKDTVCNTRHGMKDYGQLLVVKGEGRTLSKIDTPLAKIGQPIFKATKEGKWLSSVPVRWVDEKMNQLAKQQAPSESLSP